MFEAEQVMPPPGLQQSGSVSSSGAQHGASDRSFLERVRDVLAGEDSNDPIIQGLFAGEFLRKNWKHEIFCEFEEKECILKKIFEIYRKNGDFYKKK